MRYLVVGTRTVLYILILLGVGLVITLAASDILVSLEVDRCLDAGGSFDYGQGACNFVETHPYGPSSFTPAVALRRAAIGTATVIFLLQLLRMARRRARQAA